jgi:hypothetical protein
MIDDQHKSACCWRPEKLSSDEPRARSISYFQSIFGSCLPVHLGGSRTKRFCDYESKSTQIHQSVSTPTTLQTYWNIVIERPSREAGQLLIKGEAEPH